ncbi:hypothetical protein H2202_003819 [Exophiala xenobiotica]|nr:hypothetical protein H2202_003819 [Exophiala xenobiotica]KAK5196994.1 hypothetical protein LTR92_002932 [Exophiala xenobiotica]KAK5213364.1 hypothetical protein LTR41_000943 [Exophiala xenobiotica]KAK5231041.1 hypothetical protein LTR72_000221 [Exophiala xenobiotica]KAK5238023.1 hypothetical protein LTR47_001116 [Exophiala xenobiotica]
MPVLPTVGLNYDYLAATKDVWSAFAQAKDFWHEKRSFEAKPNIQLSRSLDANGDLMDDTQMFLIGTFFHRTQSHKVESHTKTLLTTAYQNNRPIMPSTWTSIDNDRLPTMTSQLDLQLLHAGMSVD